VYPAAVATATVLTIIAAAPPAAAEPAPPAPLTDTTQRVSVAGSGDQLHGSSGAPAVSANGRYVAFNSRAADVVPGDTNGTWDVFVRDRWAGTTTRVSVAHDGAQSNSQSSDPSISADGRYVAFFSLATNLVPGDPNEFGGVFVRDRTAGTTTRADVSSTGVPADSYTNQRLALSATGRYVVFSSLATNLAPGDTNEFEDVFVHDRDTGTTVRASVATSGAQANHFSQDPHITPDGRYVLFTSPATTLVPGDTNGFHDAFLRDMRQGTTSRVSVTGRNGEGLYDSYGGGISDDGRYIAFMSASPNLVPGDTNDWPDAFVRDRLSGTTTRVSVTSAGRQSDGINEDPTISADGRYVVFGSAMTNLVPGDTNNVDDVFRHDRTTGVTRRVSVTASGGQSNGWSGDHAISADGRYVAFASVASNLVRGDTNAGSDVFLWYVSARRPW
jgi:Tol biopolymer transport system component